MEIRARYVLMGVFTLSVVLSIFGFLYWMHASGGFRERAVYRIQVENSVSGLLKGAAVLFNGIRVGEVTDLRLNPSSPSQVLVSIAVDRETPIRSDTRVDIDFQGLTGVAYITMNGGTSTGPLLGAKGEPAVLVANSNGQTMGQAARDALHRLNVILDENAAPLRNTIGNLSSFSDVLAKNTERADNILAGLERMTGGKGASGQLNDLTAPRSYSGTAKELKSQVVVADPTAIIMLDTQNILIKQEKSDPAAPAGTPPRWADNLPKLIQARMIQSFENAGFLGKVNRPGDGATPDYQLLIDIRNFQAALGASADVELTGKILDNGGKVVEAKIFRASQPAGADNEAAIAALNTAFGKVASDIVVWASNTVAARADAAEKTEPEAPAKQPETTPATGTQPQ